MKIDYFDIYSSLNLWDVSPKSFFRNDKIKIIDGCIQGHGKNHWVIGGYIKCSVCNYKQIMRFEVGLRNDRVYIGFPSTEIVPSCPNCGAGYSLEPIHDDSRNIPQESKNEVLERSNKRCERCGELDKSRDGRCSVEVSSHEFHHIIPYKHREGYIEEFSHSPYNIAFLCKDCHVKAHGGDFSKTIYDTIDGFWDWAGKKDSL